jgi:TolB-like protein
MAEGDSGKSSKDELHSSGATAGTTSRPVFISYASHDAAVAQKVCSALEAVGILCWIAPRDVVPGTLYAEGIVRALDESRVLVLILSKDSVASAHVGKELERATSKRHPIIALRTDGAPLTPAFEYFLNESQWIDVGAGGTVAAITKLVEAVARHLAPGSAAEPARAPQAPARKAAKSRRVWGIAAAFVVLAFAGGYFLVGKGWLHGQGVAGGHTTIPVADKSIAVLPFVDMSEKKDQEYFADGMAEEIIDLLVKIPGLKVIGRTSSFQFKGQTEDLRTIGTKLGVAYVLEGSVRKSGDRLRVTAQLIDSRDGRHLFSQTYDRDLSDVLKMQDEIAAKIAFALEIEVSTAEDLFSRPALRNTEAYDLFLKGLHAESRFDRQGFDEALIDFKRALDLDPSFLPAAYGIASVYDGLAEFQLVPATVAFEQARRAMEHVLELDPKFGPAHAELGFIHLAYDWDLPAAERELKLARTLAANDYNVLVLAMQQALITSNWNDALKLLNHMLELDPLDPGAYFYLSWVQYRRGRLPESEAAMRRTLEIIPTFGYAHYFIGLVLLARGQPDAALAEFMKEADDGAHLAGSTRAYFALGRKADSDAALAQTLKDYPTRAVGIAGIYAFRGELDEAFKWLDRAYEQRDPALYHIKGDPQFTNQFQGDPRFKALLRKMNFPE